MKDPYQVLGVSKSVSADEIKKAYRKLAKDLHPDLHPGNKKKAEQFAEVSAAYDFLSDAEKRARYDRGEIDASGAEVRPRGGYYWSQAEGGGGRKYQREFNVDDLFSSDDLFTDLFGRGGRGRAGPRTPSSRGGDVSYRLTVSFREAAAGARKTVRLANGKTLDVNIPPGTADGQKLRLKGQGEPGPNGAPTGDAYVEVHVEPDAVFTRKDRDIHAEAKVPLRTAVLGGTITAETIHGSVSVRVPKYASSGTMLRLKGKGIADPRGTPGDHFVKLLITLPEPADADLVRALEQWATQTADGKEEP